MSKSLIVSSATARAAFSDGTLSATDVVDAKGQPVSTASLVGKNGDGNVRGRLHPAFIAHYEQATGNVVGAGVKDTATVSVPRRNAKGRLLKPVVMPVSQARALAGVTGKRGRLSSEALEAAGIAYQAAQAK